MTPSAREQHPAVGTADPALGAAGQPGGGQADEAPVGQLYGVGLGPGDPGLITRKAARLIETADVIAYHAGVGKQSNARAIAAELIPAGTREEELRYPVTTGSTDHPGGYAGAIAEFYADCAARLAGHLAAGRSVVVLAEGDPLFYGSFMYLHDRLADRFHCEVVPGVPAFSAATAVLAAPLVRQTDVLTVLPGTLEVPELARRLADTDGAIIMKLGRRFPGVVEALRQAGRLEHALYVERASMPAERWTRVAEVDPATVPYFSLIVVPGDSLLTGDPGGRRHALPRTDAPTPADGVRDASAPTPVVGAPHASAPRAGVGAAPGMGTVHVVGLGPGPEQWLTPEATAVLAAVDDVVGYGPYLDRVPQREGLTRHASGNTVETDRARQALDLALAGRQVAVVSGGDAGVFGMASAVFEAVEQTATRGTADGSTADGSTAEGGATYDSAATRSAAYDSVPVEVVPGMTAVQAVAARAGAPLGGDFAVVSLSDRLKPWAVVEERLRYAARADLVLALYNPASRSRTEQIAWTQQALLAEREADTVVVVGRDVGRAEESLTLTTLAGLDPATIDMKCLVLVGAQGTRVSRTGRVWTPRYVPERSGSPASEGPAASRASPAPERSRDGS